MPTHPPTPRLPIPPLAFETLEWVPRAPQIHSRAEVLRQTGPYQAAVTPPIAAWDPQLGGEISADVDDATRQLVEFDAHARLALGADDAALGPMSAILLRTESASSSQIEQLTTSARQLALAEIDESDTSNARTVIGNVRAMEAAVDLATEVSSDTILAMHGALMRNQQGFDRIAAGRYRSEQVWIGPGEAGPRIAEYVAPHERHIPTSIADLVAFVQREDLPLLVQVAVAHAQFETIHPFPDGNGRTGRALAQSILRNKRLVTSTTVPLSAGLLTNVDRYFAALGSYRAGDAEPIVHEFAQASRIAATTGTRLVNALVEQLDVSRARLEGVRADAAAWEILPALIGQPVVNTRYLTASRGMSDVTALRALRLLTERGVLTETTGRARGRVWQHRGILSVLDDYAAEIRRMSVH